MDPSVHTCRPAELTPEQVTAIAALWFEVWPKPPLTVHDYIEGFHEKTALRPDRQLHVLWGTSGQPLAVAESFARTIFVGTEPRTVLALASVCSHPLQRGRGWGARVVRSAFARLSGGPYDLCLFQTPVPEFYAKLGSRVVANRFVDRTHPTAPEARPFWDPWVMIHPAEASWSEDPVDLNGPGY